MRFIRAAVFAVSLSSLAVAAPAIAKKETLSALQVQEMQSHEVEATKEITFSSVMSVLQDSGYRINSADKDTGLITATASTASKTTWLPFVGFGRSKKTPVVSAYIEQYGPAMTKIRLNFVMVKASANTYGSNEDEEPILDPSVYRDTFEKIDQAVFIRSAAQTPAPASASTTATATN
ncbi:hypothetical protein SAMN05660666_02328 [Novosphingobium aromaticivorans]|uniref:hypothetical protein n=1 Tax=Novosphingobium aromaticivorans TaxID=48935 RepID=UPI0008770E48|nr:hypothetical protein [Novosphingobium aromaticivorans]SCY65810.1 hypothetical protein SAMN05660666_02328 [Novosphingobium aromaticivorans]